MTKEIVSRIFGIILFVWMIAVTGIPQFMWNHMADSVEPIPDISYEEAQVLYDKYRQQYVELIEEAQIKISDNNLSAYDYLFIVERGTAIRNDRRLDRHFPGRHTGFDVPQDLVEYNRNQMFNSEPGSGYRKEFDDALCEIMCDCGKTPEEQAEIDRQVRQFFFQDLPLWLLRVYLLWMIAFVLVCINKLWRDPDNTVPLDPRQWGSFLMRLPAYLWYWNRYWKGGAEIRRYAKKSEVRGPLVQSDRELLHKFTRGLISLEELRHEKEIVQGRRVQRSFALAMSFSVIVTLLPSFVHSQIPDLDDGTTVETVTECQQCHFDNGPPGPDRPPDIHFFMKWILRPVYKVVLSQICCCWYVFTHILRPQCIQESLGPPPKYGESSLTLVVSIWFTINF